MWRLDAVSCAAAGLVYGGVLAIRTLLSLPSDRSLQMR